MEKQLLTAEIYWAAQNPEVGGLRTAPPDNVVDLALLLAKRGHIIDYYIMVLQGDPLFTMQLRKDYGYTWVPSLLQAPPAVAPGLWFPGVPSYDPDNPPKGSIKVSIYAEDYPPFITPPPPVVEPAVIVGSPVFANMTGIGSMWYSARDDKMTIGAIHKDQRGTFLKRSQVMIGGSSSIWWERTA